MDRKFLVSIHFKILVIDPSCNKIVRRDKTPLLDETTGLMNQRLTLMNNPKHGW